MRMEQLPATRDAAPFSYYDEHKSVSGESFIFIGGRTPESAMLFYDGPAFTTSAMLSSTDLMPSDLQLGPRERKWLFECWAEFTGRGASEIKSEYVSRQTLN